LPFDHFKVPTTLGLAPGGQFLASVRSIGPDLFQTREHWGKPGKQTPSPFSIVQISGSDIHSQEKTECIHENMAFAAFHALVRIKPTDPGGFLHRFDALRINDRRTRLGVSPNSFTFSFPQRCKQAKPDALEAQAPEMVEHGLPRRKVNWQIPPGTAGAQHVEDGIENNT
jgi:hypothetical protein